MIPDIGGAELLIVAALALIVVGPKDLPLMLRKLGQFVGKMRGMASEFRASFDEMARQSELEELRREVQAMREGQYPNPVKDAADAAKDAHVDQVFADIDASLSSGATQSHPDAGAEIHTPALTTDNSVAEPVEAGQPKRAPRKKAVAAVEPAAAKAMANTPAAKKTPAAKTAAAAPAAKAQRKRVAKAGVSTASDIAS